MNCSKVLVLSCAWWLLLCSSTFAAQSPQTQVQESLTIQVMEGHGAINNVSRQTAFEPVVEIQDASGAPVSGAMVTFILPAVGPGGAFADGSKTLMVQTDTSGRAGARGLRPNSQTGQFDIRVTASHNGQTATATITQTNAAPAVSGTRSGRKWAILLGVIGGGAAAAAIAAAGGGGGGSTPTNNPPAAEIPSGTITPGAPGFGPPR